MSRPSRPQASSSGSRADIDLLPHTKSSRPTEARILSSQRPQPCRSSKDIRTIRTFVIDCLIASLAILFFIYGIAAARQSGKLLHNNSRTQFQLFEASLAGLPTRLPRQSGPSDWAGLSRSGSRLRGHCRVATGCRALPSLSLIGCP
jgi:hypothetical protein